MTFTTEQVIAACGDAAKAAIESERETTLNKLENLIFLAQRNNLNQFVIYGLRQALKEVQNV